MNIRIETQRLVLRPLGLQDLDTTNAYAMDPENTRYMLFLPNDTSEETQQYLRNAQTEWEKDQPSFYEFAVTLDGVHIGAVSLYPNEDGSAEFGWILNKRYWHKGYASEAARALLDYAASELGIEHFIAHCDLENTASAHVMERLGMVKISESGGRKSKLLGDGRRELQYELQLRREETFLCPNLTNQDMLRIAMEQSAEDMGCRAEDFLKSGNVTAVFHLGAHARRYLKEPIICNLVSYGSNIVAASVPEVSDLVSEYLDRYSEKFYHCFETPNMHWLNERLEKKGYKICFMAEYYLPDISRIPDLTCPYELRVLGQKDFTDLYLPEWGNALCEERRQLDVLGVGAYDEGKLVGLAGCSADCDQMWQIGVDVLPEYRRRGIASALTSTLAKEILKRGKVPFYCSAWSNIRSVRNAVKSGFIPAWVEMTVKPASIVDEMNKA